MQKYLITNPRYSGEALLLYNDAGLLQKIDVSQTDMDVETIDKFKRASPAHSDGIEKAFGEHTIIVALQVEILFEHFWKKYNFKYNKERAEKVWDRLNNTEKTLAYNAIDRYHKHLRKLDTQAKMHPDTFLRNKAWQNDYK